MANGWTIVIGFFVVVALALASYIFAPKGENQTIWRSSLLLAISAMYLMWALTLLAQLHPLIAPRRQDLVPHSGEPEAAGVPGMFF